MNVCMCVYVYIIYSTTLRKHHTNLPITCLSLEYLLLLTFHPLVTAAHVTSLTPLEQTLTKDHLAFQP